MFADGHIHGQSVAPPPPLPDPRDEELIPLAPRRSRRDDDDADFLPRRLPRAPLLSSTSLRQTLRTTAMAPMVWSATNEASSRGNHTVPRERLASKQSQAMLRDIE